MKPFYLDQITTSVESGQNFVTMPAQQTPFILHAIQFPFIADGTVITRNPALRINFGGVVDIIEIFLHQVNSLEFGDYSGSQIGTSILTVDGLAFGYCFPLPPSLVLDSRFIPRIQVPEMQGGDQFGPVSWLIQSIDN
jgi:hypothetical protein